MGASLFTEGDELALTGRIYDELHGEYFGPLGTLAPNGSIGLTQDQAQLSYDAPLSTVFKLMARFYIDRQRIDDLIDLNPPGYVSVPPGLSSGFFPDGEQKSLTVTSLTYGGEARLTANLPFHNTATAGVQLEEEGITFYQAGINFGPGGSYLGGLEPDPERHRSACERRFAARARRLPARHLRALEAALDHGRPPSRRLLRLWQQLESARLGGLSAVEPDLGQGALR